MVGVTWIKRLMQIWALAGQCALLEGKTAQKLVFALLVSLAAACFGSDCTNGYIIFMVKICPRKSRCFGGLSFLYLFTNSNAY